MLGLYGEMDLVPIINNQNHTILKTGELKAFYMLVMINVVQPCIYILSILNSNLHIMEEIKMGNMEIQNVMLELKKKGIKLIKKPLKIKYNIL